MSRLVKRRVANPAPSVLALVNGGRKMAAKKRSSTKRRTNAAQKRRPTKRASVRGRTASTPKRNPPRKRYSRPRGRRRNPIGTGTIVEGFKLAGSGIVIGLAQPFVRNLVGGFVGNSVFASVGVTLGTGYALSYASRLTRFTSALQRPLELATWTIAATQLASSFILPLLRPGGTAVNPSLGWTPRPGLRGIGVTTGIPPSVVPPPLPPAAAANRNGMHGLGMRPGNYGR